MVSKFSPTMESLGFKFSPYNHAFFLVQHTFRGYMLLLYVDNMVIIGNDHIGIL